ncbi:MAG: DUF7718 family protein [Limisphaerales bacterium]
MPDKAYRIYLEKGFVIAVSIQMADGRVVGFVVRLLRGEGGNERDVARYDTAHGWPHLDLLTPTGDLREKRWMKARTFGEALTLAVEDFRLNYENYRQDH